MYIEVPGAHPEQVSGDVHEAEDQGRREDLFFLPLSE